MSSDDDYRIASGLSEKPGFYEIRKYLNALSRDGEKFLFAVERFGANDSGPVEPLRAAYGEVRACLVPMEGKLSLPGADLRRIEAAARAVAEAVMRFKREIITALEKGAASPSEEPPYELAGRYWSGYDRSYEKEGKKTGWERRRVQRLLYAARDPWAVQALVYAAIVGEKEKLYCLRSEFRRLLRHSPLLALQSRTMFQHAMGERPKIRESVMSGGHGILSYSFADLAAGFAVKARRKEAEQTLKAVGAAAFNEVWGRGERGRAPSMVEELGLWEGARLALDHTDAAYRKAALSVLSEVIFSFCVEDLPEEVLAFVLKALKDPDGHVRYKAVRFARYLPLLRNNDIHPGALDGFEKAVEAQLSSLPRKSPFAKSHEQVLDDLDCMRRRLEMFKRGAPGRRTNDLQDLEDGEEVGEAPNRPPMDRRAMEGITNNLMRHLESGRYAGIEEMNQALQRLTAKGESLEKLPPRNALDVAQQLMYEAWDEQDPRRRVEMALRAVTISPDCADAYVLLAEEAARSLEEEKAFYKEGVAAGERALGAAFIKEESGRLWGHLQARPYMRARVGLAQTLWVCGERETAVKEAYELLRLNDNDNQGVRYVLLSWLAALGRFEEMRRFMSGTDDDTAADWLYADVLARFADEGPSPAVEKALKAALEENPHVPAYLMGRKRLTGRLPDLITVGGEEEAQSLADAFREGWRRVPGALEWLEKTALPQSYSAGRNDPCPCGSGRKFKKCHGV